MNKFLFNFLGFSVGLFLLFARADWERWAPEFTAEQNKYANRKNRIMWVLWCLQWGFILSLISYCFFS